MNLIDENWARLFDKYQIEKAVSETGLFYITADQIREFKEPRLMTKFDTRESLPQVFGGKLGILPVTRGKYVIGEFDLYHDFPEEQPGIVRVAGARIPDYLETIDLSDVRSEAGAINILGLTGILEDFLGEEGLFQTVSGRMASGSFSFHLDGGGDNAFSGSRTIEVINSQVEIDGGFEGRGSFCVLEGKNVVHSNFLVRQLYYPYRLWTAKIRKPVRPVFMIYSNQVFRLLEYEFEDEARYNSIRLVREKSYSLEDTAIAMKELWAVWKKTGVAPEPDVAFVQADSLDKVISLVENLDRGPLTAAQIAQLFGFRERQSDYYYNACRYLGLTNKEKDESGITRVYLTELGRELLCKPYKQRQLFYAGLIFQHRIFHELFGTVLQTGRIPDKRMISMRMRELQVCGASLISRRASSVAGWLKWLVRLCGEKGGIGL